LGYARNGDLLTVAEEAGFDVLLTTDKNMRYQQNLAGRKLAIVVLGQQSDSNPKNARLSGPLSWLERNLILFHCRYPLEPYLDVNCPPIRYRLTSRASLVAFDGNRVSKQEAIASQFA
jgi:hypothetical protein